MIQFELNLCKLWKGNGNTLQYSCLGESHGQSSLTGYSPWGRKELVTTECLSTWNLGWRLIWGIFKIYDVQLIQYLCSSSTEIFVPFSKIRLQLVKKNPPAMQETQVHSMGREDPLRKGMAAHSSILPRKIPWTQESGGLWSTKSQRVGHDWATKPPHEVLDLWVCHFTLSTDFTDNC